VLAAALAGETSRIGLRAGSVVLPLHDVARVAEEWAVVDALSAGRVGVSLATGWNPGDFVLGRCEFTQRRAYTLANIDTLCALWRGESLPAGPDGTTIRTYPTPVQPDLPLWLTATSGSATFEEAGRRGLRVLTAYLQQDRAQLEDNIQRYRALSHRFRPDTRPHVTLMVHAYVADSAAQALATVHDPLLAYLRQFVDLNERGQIAEGAAADALSAEEKEELVRYSVAKYARERGLIGDPAGVADRLRYLAGIGVDELACFVDFGLAPDLVLTSLRRLAEVHAAVAR